MIKLFKWLGEQYVEAYMSLYGNMPEKEYIALTRSGCVPYGVCI